MHVYLLSDWHKTVEKIKGIGMNMNRTRVVVGITNF